MKLQPAAQKELARIALGTAVCTALMLAVFALLGALKVFPFGWAVVLGALGGFLVAVGSFAGLCFTVQAAAAEADEKRSRAKMQLSYNIRLLAQAVWCVVAFALPCFQFVAAALPLLFPRVVIFFLQITGRYQPQAAAPDGPAEEAQAASASRPPEQER